MKTYKPWFIGREAFLEGEKTRHGEVVRFRFNEKGVRMAHPAIRCWITRQGDRLGDQLCGR